MSSIEENSAVDHSKLTRKYPFYVWHLTKRFKSLTKMDKDLEGEEAKFINLYSSDYVRESIDSSAAQRETKNPEASN